ncbi:MAG TPA: DNA helicase RecQ [Anaerohalosphaeraceae bacterium]|nr:DNA helicase RecQ [Anaerohalosphaeraceae bacterium]
MPLMHKVQQALTKHWGYESFLPLQKEAMDHLCRKQDCIVVLPTGGGKSLCYQAPAAAMDGMAVVVSPLISLMKDQVDALTECGVSAMRLDSSLSMDEQNHVLGRIQKGTLKLLYVSPERLLSKGFAQLLEKTRLSYIAVDEAHCVSMWGHDFRPEYRQLGRLKKVFPGITIAAYTATATEQVRNDIADQLHLEKPGVLVGSFDRPNLVYKVRPRNDIVKQVCSVLDRHKGESGIIYCIRRKDVDAMCAHLEEKGYRIAPYHAGLTDQMRKTNQDRFIKEQIDTIVATIAFGMGIDKSNVRYVVHAGMPKSLEHYQQESGRAGRDGLEAECCLFYSGGDYGVWKSLMRDMPEEAKKIATDKLDRMYRYCAGALCRHNIILDYFGQTTDKTNCQACDVCLGELDSVDDALVIAQKILSCVLRLGQRFGGGYTALVLTGSAEQRIVENGHDKLSTYNLLNSYPRTLIQDWIEQLVGQGVLAKTGEYHVLGVTEKGRAVLKGDAKPRLFKPAQKPAKVSKAASESWEGVDKGLFETVKLLRAAIAAQKQLPAYVIFGDAGLRDMARRRPSTLEQFLRVQGVGQKKCDQYGKRFIETIRDYCRTHSLDMDIDSGPTAESDISHGQAKSAGLSQARLLAFELFKKKQSVKQVAAATKRAESTTIQYLVEFIQKEKIQTPRPWVDDATHRQIVDAAVRTQAERMKDIYDYLEGQVNYDQIRISTACLRNIE